MDPLLYSVSFSLNFCTWTCLSSLCWFTIYEYFLSCFLISSKSNFMLWRFFKKIFFLSSYFYSAITFHLLSIVSCKNVLFETSWNFLLKKFKLFALSSFLFSIYYKFLCIVLLFSFYFSNLSLYFSFFYSSSNLSMLLSKFYVFSAALF